MGQTKQTIQARLAQLLRDEVPFYEDRHLGTVVSSTGSMVGIQGSC